MFPPKTKAAQEFEYCGKPGFVWVLFWERNTCGRRRDSSGGEGGRDSMWETGGEGELQQSRAARAPVLGEARDAGELAGKDLLL